MSYAHAGVAQLVEHLLAKEKVASSNLVSRSSSSKWGITNQNLLDKNRLSRRFCVWYNGPTKLDSEIGDFEID